MDFVVSKVAMSVCALLVASILAGLVDRSDLMEGASELRAVLDELCGLVDRGLRSGSESTAEWTVPTLSDGDIIVITMTSGVVRGQAGGHKDAQQTTTPLHLWRHSGMALNASVVEHLDEEAQDLTVVSGQSVTVAVLEVVYENETRLFAFVWA